MQYKDLTFSSYLIIVDEKPLDEAAFYKVFIADQEFEVNNNDTNYTITVSKVDRFARLYIEYGNPFPRPDNVRNTETHQPEENPRQPNQYEPKQEFGLIHFHDSVLWLSNSKRKNFFVDIFKERFETNNVIIKNVYSEEEFINSIKNVEEIKFSALPNLFSQTNSLTKELSEEILGYGASVATLIMKFTNQTVGEKILSKIRSLLSNKTTYRSLVITGRDADNFGIIFNNEFLSKTIPLKGKVNENEVYDVENVFSQLIAALKND